MAQCLAEAHRLSRWSMVLWLNEGLNVPLHLHRRSDQNPTPLFTGLARRPGRRQREPGSPPSSQGLGEIHYLSDGTSPK